MWLKLFVQPYSGVSLRQTEREYYLNTLIRKGGYDFEDNGRVKAQLSAENP